MTTTLRTAYATLRTPDISDAARALFGDDVSIAGTPNADPACPLATWPYPADSFEVVGLACAHRSGPTFTVVRRKAEGASDRRPVLVDGLADLRTWIANNDPCCAISGLGDVTAEERGGAVGQLAAAFREEDHPAWGSDWGPWLAEHAERITGEWLATGAR